MNTIEIILTILVALVGGGVVWFGFHMFTQNGRLMVRMEMLERILLERGIMQDAMGNSALSGVPSGTVLNNFALPVLGGGTMTLAEWRGRKVVLIYLSPSCGHCAALLPDLVAAIPAGNTDPAAVIISSGTEEENRRFFGKHPPSCPILMQETREVSSLHSVRATPMAYLVDEQGAVSGSAAVGKERVLALLRGEESPQAPGTDHSNAGADQSLAASRINRDGLKAGTVAPEFKLPMLDGAEISLSSLRGKPVLLVFSDPNCGPCNELLPKLEQVHRTEDLQVLMIGRGEAELNREKAVKLGLTFPVVLQRSWEISRAYGMFATPIGYLVGEDGILVEDVAVGGNAILALAARRNASVRVGP